MKRIFPKQLLLVFILLLNAFSLFSQTKYALPKCYHAGKKFQASSTEKTARTATSSAADYDVKFYGLDIEADNLSAFITARVEMKAMVTAATIDGVVLELSNMLEVDSVYINGQRTTFKHDDDVVEITVTEPLVLNEIFSTVVFYHGNGATGGFFSGISNAVSSAWGNQITWTLSEPLNAKDWFVCKQVLEDKADSAHINITVPEGLMAGSNGILKNVVQLNNQKKRFEWVSRNPIAYYLISIAVGDYMEYNTSAMVGDQEMIIQNFIYDNPETLSTFKNNLDEIDDMVELFSNTYGPYPFANEKYGHCMAPIGGGMEHQTMSTMGFFEFTLDAHELGHQWFGDNVTCATWQDIWINEGFATYSTYLAFENLRSLNEANAWRMDIYNNILSRTDGSVYVPLASATDETRIFDHTLTYYKGAAIIHMLRNVINDDDVFFTVLSGFQQTFGDSVATGEDFKNYTEESTGIELDNFFNEWYYGEGYPAYKIEWNFDSDTLFIRHEQTTSSMTTPFFHTPLEFKLFREVEDTTIFITPSMNNELFKIKMPQQVTQISFDPGKWLLTKNRNVKRNTNLKASNPDVVIGTEDPLFGGFSLYPNPANQKLIISSKHSSLFHAIIEDVSGRVIANFSTNDKEIVANVSGIRPGLYFVRITAEGKHYYNRIAIE